MDEVQRDLGRHDAEISGLQRDIAEIKDGQNQMRLSQARIEKALAEARGGARMLIAVGTVGGAVGAAIVKAIAFVKGAP